MKCSIAVKRCTRSQCGGELNWVNKFIQTRKTTQRKEELACDASEKGNLSKENTYSLQFV